MLIRILIFLLMFSVSLFAQKAEILAKTMLKEGDIVHAKEDVVLYSDTYIITADEAYYNIKSGDLELFGSITIMDGTDFSIRSGYSKLNLNDDSGTFTPMFGYMIDSKIWVKCDKAEFDKNLYIIKNTIVSSCNVQNPDWKIKFTTGEFERDSKFFSAYNASFYIKDLPIFYLPYFSFSTDRTRRTGLLRPEFALTSKDGFYYKQPIFFAPYKNWDFQLNPQIRTKRGSGVHGNFRFVDSLYSHGNISFGEFKEKEEYVLENNLKNDIHYGFSVKYDRSKLISDYFSEEYNDGLWVNFNYLNDINYFNTIDNSEKEYDSLVQSTFNYYFKDNVNYFGLYAKYYIDTLKLDNDDTIHELPTLQYHKFSNSLFFDNFYYSVDTKTTKYTSKLALNAITNQMNIPLTMHFPFINDFLHLKISKEFFLTDVNYENQIDNGGGQVIENFDKFSLYTELAKKYDDFYHTIYFGTEYTIPGNSTKNDGYKEMEENSDFSEFDSLVLNTQENVSLSLIEYFYNNNGQKMISHSLRQSILIDNDEGKNEYLDLSNNLQIFFTSNINLKNHLNYSYKKSRFSKFQTSFNLKLDEYTTNFIHTYQISELDKIDDYLTFSITTNYVKNYNLFGKANYDIENDYFKSWETGITMKKKCWDYRFVYREEREATLTGDGSSSINKKGFYLIFNLYPIGKIGYDFIKDAGVE